MKLERCAKPSFAGIGREFYLDQFIRSTSEFTLMDSVDELGPQDDRDQESKNIKAQ